MTKLRVHVQLLLVIPLDQSTALGLDDSNIAPEVRLYQLLVYSMNLNVYSRIHKMKVSLVWRANSRDKI